MAEKRMFSQKIVSSDAFTSMPLSAQALYFAIGMNADDDGFINNAKLITQMIGAKPKDLKLLIEKRFLLDFGNGIMVVKHWRMNNTIKKDRYNPTQYQEELSQLIEKRNKSYTELKQGDSKSGAETEPFCATFGTTV